MFTRISIVTSALLASTAFASADYPGEIQTKYGLGSLPPQLCTLCHPGATGTGTAISPFARALMMRGLTSGNAMSLSMALDQMEADMVDSDNDGVIDVQELRNGTDPNRADATVTDGGTGGGGGSTVVVPNLRYGCGNSVLPELFFLSLLAPLVRRRLKR